MTIDPDRASHGLPGDISSREPFYHYDYDGIVILLSLSKGGEVGEGGRSIYSTPLTFSFQPFRHHRRRSAVSTVQCRFLLEGLDW